MHIGNRSPPRRVEEQQQQKPQTDAHRTNMSAQRIPHLNAVDPAAMAEALRKGNGATAADCGFGNQRVKPTELLTLSQQLGVEDQLGVGADDLEAAQGLEESSAARSCAAQRPRQRLLRNAAAATSRGSSPGTSALLSLRTSSHHPLANLSRSVSGRRGSAADHVPVERRDAGCRRCSVTSSPPGLRAKVPACRSPRKDPEGWLESTG